MTNSKALLAAVFAGIALGAPLVEERQACAGQW